MLGNKHKTDYLILAVLGAVTGGILITLVLLDLIKKDHSGTPGVRTTFSTNEDAAIVCYTLFERLGLMVGRSEKAVLGNEMGKTDVLFLLDPTIPLHAGEIKNIHTWLFSGGVLICTEIPKGLHPDLDKLNKKINHSSNYRRMSRKAKQSRESQFTYIPDERKNLPLAQDISEIYFGTSEVFGADVLNTKRPGNSIVPLLYDNRGIRIVMRELGLGRIIILSDSSFLANGLIGKSDNSVLAVNLISYALSNARDNKVIFNEYHLGYGYHQTGFSVLSRMLFTTTAGWAVLSLTVAGVLYIIYKGRRFGFRRSLGKKHRRSKIEYIYGVGSTYRSAGANRLTLELIYDWLKRKTTDLTGLTTNVSNETIAGELSRRSGLDSRKYKEIFDRCDKLIAQSSLSERHMLLMIKQLVRIEMEVFNEHRNRK